MKRIISTILIITFLCTTFACSNVVNASSTLLKMETSSSDELTTKIEKLFQKDAFKTILNGQSISQLISEEVSKMSEEDKKNLEKQYPQLSLDKSNFENDEKTYIWLSNLVKILLKSSIEDGYITQDQINEYKGYLSIIGVKIPDIEIKKGMSDDDIKKLSINFVDILDKLSNPLILKLLGIDLTDPQILDYIRSMLNLKK